MAVIEPVNCRLLLRWPTCRSFCWYTENKFSHNRFAVANCSWLCWWCSVRWWMNWCSQPCTHLFWSLNVRPACGDVTGTRYRTRSAVSQEYSCERWQRLCAVVQSCVATSGEYVWILKTNHSNYLEWSLGLSQVITHCCVFLPVYNCVLSFNNCYSFKQVCVWDNCLGITREQCHCGWP